MIKPLIDQDFIIRPYEISDVKPLYESVRSSLALLTATMLWCDPNYSIEDSKAWVYSRRDAWNEEEELSFVIEQRSSQTIIGGVGLNLIEPENCFANYGYWVHEAYNGRGIATRASRLLLDYAFKELNFLRVEMRILSRNVASQRVAEKLGASLEGTMRNRIIFRGQVEDLLLYALVQDDWEVKNGGAS